MFICFTESCIQSAILPEMLRVMCYLSALSWDMSAYSALNWKVLAFLCCQLTLKTHSSLSHTQVLCISEAVHQAGLFITLIVRSLHDRLLLSFQPSVFPKLHLILHSSFKSCDLAVGLHRSWNAWGIFSSYLFLCIWGYFMLPEGWLGLRSKWFCLYFHSYWCQASIIFLSCVYSLLIR